MSLMIGRTGTSTRSAAFVASSVASEVRGGVSRMASVVPCFLPASSTDRKRATWGRHYSRSVGGAPIIPIGGRRLGVEVDEDRGMTRFGRRDGQVLGRGRLATPTFLAGNRNNLHESPTLQSSPINY
jgi:hypothetical protein